MTNTIAVTLGDRHGIGPEIVASVLAREPIGPASSCILVIGDQRVLEQGARSAKVDLDIVATSDPAVPEGHGWALLDRPFDAPGAPMGQVSEAAGAETLATLRYASELAAANAIRGLVFAPLNKSAMRLAGHAAGDEIEFLAHTMPPAGQFGEINILDQLWTSRATSHIPLRTVCDHLDTATVLGAIELISGALTDAGRSNPKIAVAALNPHAGENGAFGREEIDVIRPAVERAKQSGFNVAGPFPADTVFPHAIGNGCDGVVTMFHDQGQIALKLLGLGKGVTLLAGFPIPIATPGHGTAYDIAGQGTANDDGVRTALRLVQTMVQCKQEKTA